MNNESDAWRLAAEYLARYLTAAWSKETSNDPTNWSFENPAWGQSEATALVAQDFLGGLLVRLDMREVEDKKLAKVRWHYINYVNGIFIDITALQSKDSPVYEKLHEICEKKMREREELLQNPEIFQRYMILRAEILRLKGNRMVVN